MQDIGYITLEKTAGHLNASDIEALVAGIRGEVLTPRDGAYDAARTIWNAMMDRRPAVIVRAQQPADVRHAVNFAREHRMLVSVRGGGHHIAGNCRLRGRPRHRPIRMRTVRVDPERRARPCRPRGVAERFRPRGAGLRPGDPARHQLDHRRRRAHPRRRLRLADAASTA